MDDNSSAKSPALFNFFRSFTDSLTLILTVTYIEILKVDYFFYCGRSIVVDPLHVKQLDPVLKIDGSLLYEGS